MLNLGGIGDCFVQLFQSKSQGSTKAEACQDRDCEIKEQSRTGRKFGDGSGINDGDIVHADPRRNANFFEPLQQAIIQRSVRVDLLLENVILDRTPAEIEVVIFSALTRC